MVKYKFRNMPGIKELDLLGLTEFNRIGVAISGGIDSLSLLNLLVDLLGKSSIHALHVNHGISQDSDDWESHCRDASEEIGIEFHSWKINQMEVTSNSEANLRKKRYEFLTSWANHNDVICTAHHLDDQIETILFRLFRGTGINGMQGIKQKTIMNNVNIQRPFLSFSKDSIKEYALSKNIKWIEDKSNLLSNYDRNYIRNDIIPLVNLRWPSYQESIIKFSKSAKTANKLHNEIADNDLARVKVNNLTTLSLDHLTKLSEERAKNLLHRWIWFLSNKLIESVVVNEIYHNVIQAREDASPQVVIGKINLAGSYEIRRYEDYLYAIPYSEKGQQNFSSSYSWDLLSSLSLPTGKLRVKKVFGKGIKVDKYSKVEVRGRVGGESVRLSNKKRSKSLKKFFQEKHIPPWMRNRMPLIYLNNELAAIGSLWIDEKYVAASKDPGIEIDWKDSTL